MSDEMGKDGDGYNDGYSMDTHENCVTNVVTNVVTNAPAGITTNGRGNVFMGIDPGVTGALSLVGCEGELIDVWDMPVESRGSKSAVSPVALARMVEGFCHMYRVQLTVIEQVGSMPKQGITSAFNFGETLGLIKGVVAAKGLPYTMLRPADWKKRHHLCGKDKDFARTLVSRRYPACDKLTRKKDIDRAEAILIALVARSVSMGVNV